MKVADAETLVELKGIQKGLQASQSLDIAALQQMFELEQERKTHKIMSKQIGI